MKVRVNMLMVSVVALAVWVTLGVFFPHVLELFAALSIGGVILAEILRAAMPDSGEIADNSASPERMEWSTYSGYGGAVASVALLLIGVGSYYAALVATAAVAEGVYSRLSLYRIHKVR